MKKSAGAVAFNSVILTPLFAMADIFLNGFTFTYTVADWPTVTQIAGQFIFFILMEDLAFYWAHRTLHHRWFYWIHKRHHEYKIPITLSASYTHPIEFIVAGTIPYGIGYRLLATMMPVHLVTIFVWSVYRLL